MSNTWDAGILASNVRTAVEQSDRSIQEIAEHFGISELDLSTQLQSGRLDVGAFFGIADVLGVDFTTLLPHDDRAAA